MKGSALNIAKETAENMNKLSMTKNQELSEYQLSPLINRIYEKEKYLQEYMFYHFTKN